MPRAREYSGRSTTEFTPGESAYAVCRRYEDRPPALVVRLGEGASFAVALDPDGEMTDGQMRFARDLLIAAQAYLVECERIRVAARAASPGRRHAARHSHAGDAPAAGAA